MASESLSFDILARDQASSKFRDVGNAALDASAKMDIAAASSKLWSDTAIKQGKASDTAIAAMKSHTNATNLLADAENVLAGKATVTTKLLADQGRVFDDTAKKADNAAKATTGLAGGGGGGGGFAGGGMGALIGAGVALAPVLVTTGIGLTGLAAAAYGIYKPISNAAQATGGLQANLAKLDPEQQQVARGLLGLGKTFAGFQNNLQPVVLGDFNQGIRLAGTLLHDVEPVAAATGKAFGTFIGQVDATFQSGTWQSFFTFMARTAGPDVQLLGQNFTSLMMALPPLLQQMQPVATDLLSITNAALKLVGATAQLNNSTTSTGDHMNALQRITGGLRTLLFSPGAGLLAALKLLHITGGQAASGVAAVVTPAQSAAKELQAMADATTSLMTAQQKALGAQTTYGGDLVTTANDAAALEKALDATHGKIGLNTAAQRSSFAAANTYITDLGNTAAAAFQSGHGVDASITAISKGLPILDQAKTKNKQYWQEVQTLVGWLDKLRLERAIHETIFVSGNGTFTVRPGTKLGLPGGTAGGPFAAGGRVPSGYPNDTYLARLTSGEAVVPARLTPAVAPFLGAHGVPGFASGMIPSYSGSVAGLPPWGTHNLNATAAIIDQAVAKATAAAIKSARSASFGGGSGGPASGTVRALQQYAASLFGAYGWGMNQLPSLIALWNGESGWNPQARNPTSGAFGIPQALPPGKMGAAAAAGNAAAQIRWGEGYIHSVYGSPANAYGTWLSRSPHWYDNGGWLHPGVTMAVNNTGQSERVVSPAADKALAAALNRLAAALENAPERTGAAVGAVINGTARGALYSGRYSSR